MSLELTLIVEDLHGFEVAKRLGSLSEEYAKEAQTIYMDAGDASALGLRDGDVVEVASEEGLIKARVRVSSCARRGLAIMPRTPISMALVKAENPELPVKVRVSKASGEPTSLDNLLPP